MEIYLIVIASIEGVCYLVFILVMHTSIGKKLEVTIINQDDFQDYDTQTPNNKMMSSTVSPMLSKPEKKRCILHIPQIRFPTKKIEDMFLVSMMIFFLPTVYPELISVGFDGNATFLVYFNCLFLVLMPIGAALAAWVKFYYVSIISLFQICVFLYLVLPTFAFLSGTDVPMLPWTQICRKFYLKGSLPF